MPCQASQNTFHSSEIKLPYYMQKKQKSTRLRLAHLKDHSKWYCQYLWKSTRHSSKTGTQQLEDFVTATDADTKPPSEESGEVQDNTPPKRRIIISLPFGNVWKQFAADWKYPSTKKIKSQTTVGITTLHHFLKALQFWRKKVCPNTILLWFMFDLLNYELPTDVFRQAMLLTCTSLPCVVDK